MNYEFNVQIWEEEGVFRYGIVQEFESDGSDAYEVLAYGETTSLDEAAAKAGEEIKAIFNEEV